MDEYTDDVSAYCGEPADLQTVSRAAAKRALKSLGEPGRLWDCDTFDKYATLDLTLLKCGRSEFDDCIESIGETGLPEPAGDAIEGRILGSRDILTNLARCYGYGYETVMLRSAEHPSVNENWVREILDAMEVCHDTTIGYNRSGVDALQYSMCIAFAGNPGLNGCLLADVLALNSPQVVGHALADNPNLNGTSIAKIVKSYSPITDTSPESLAAFYLHWENTLGKLFYHPNAKMETKVEMARAVIEWRVLLKDSRVSGKETSYLVSRRFEKSVASAVASLMIDPASRDFFTPEEISEVLVWVAAH